MAQALARTAGEHRAFLRHELVDDTTWARCPQVEELLRPLGIEDRLMCGIAVAPDVEILVGVDRAAGDARFGELDRDLMGAMAEQLAWFHRRVAWSHGMSAAGEMFQKREREIVAQLLSPRSEKQIASALGLTERCTHQYIVGVYRKLGVSGRAEMVARLLHGDRALDESVPQIASWVPSSRSSKTSGVYASHEIRQSTGEGRAVRRVVQGR
jgi:DNA-binding CsgD family transcriptional regulator